MLQTWMRQVFLLGIENQKPGGVKEHPGKLLKTVKPISAFIDTQSMLRKWRVLFDQFPCFGIHSQPHNFFAQLNNVLTLVSM